MQVQELGATQTQTHLWSDHLVSLDHFVGSATPIETENESGEQIRCELKYI